MADREGLENTPQNNNTRMQETTKTLRKKARLDVDCN